METGQLLSDAERDAAAVATVALRMNAPRSTHGNGVYVRTAGGGVAVPTPMPALYSAAAIGDSGGNGGGGYHLGTRMTAGDSGDPMVMADEYGDIYPPTLALLETSSNRSGDDFTLAEALDVIGIGPFHYRLFLAIGLISVASGLGSTGLALFPPLVRCSLHLTSWQEAILTSSSLFGMACGGVGMAHLATRFGRRMEVIFMIIWTSYFGLLSGVTSGFYWLLALRFVVGVGQGGAGQSILIVFENIPARHHPLAASILTFFVSLGSTLEAMAVKFLIPEGGGMAWRYLVFLNALILLFCIVFQMWIVESPHFLLNIHGNRKKATEALETAANMNRKVLPSGRLVTDRERQLLPLSPHRSTTRYRADKHHDLFSDGSRPSPLEEPSERGDHAPPAAGGGGSSPSEGFLRSSRMQRTTAIVSVAWVALSIAMVGSAILPEGVLLARELADGPCTGHVDVYEDGRCQKLPAEQYTHVIIVFASELPAVLIAYFSAKVLGHRFALVVTFFLCGVFFSLLVICPTSIWLTTLLLAAARLSAVSARSLLTAYTPLVFPAYMQGLATSLSATLFRTTSIFVPFLSQVMLRRYVFASESLHAAVCAVASVALLAMPKERKRGSTEDSED